MAHILALDIGTARTGLAFGDDAHGFIVALGTCRHKTTEALADHVLHIIGEKHIDQLVIGLPLLPSGEEGKQAGITREAASVIERRSGLSPEFIDERYTTKAAPSGLKSDPDAESACQILTVFLEQKKRKNGIDI